MSLGRKKQMMIPLSIVQNSLRKKKTGQTFLMEEEVQHHFEMPRWRFYLLLHGPGLWAPVASPVHCVSHQLVYGWQWLPVTLWIFPLTLIWLPSSYSLFPLSDSFHLNDTEPFLGWAGPRLSQKVSRSSLNRALNH